MNGINLIIGCAVFGSASLPHISLAISMNMVSPVSAMVCGFFLWQSSVALDNLPPVLASSGE
jgi:hypothetical protein